MTQQIATAAPSPRTGGRILIDQLVAQGVRHVFCVPGESYLAALDAMYDSPIEVTVCRQEGGAAMMAEAHGKLTGEPGICFVTRGPGATNASPGVHIAAQDSTPMILFVGQVARPMRGREAFQEIDYRAVFGGLAKWVTEIDDAARLPELVARAFSVARSGRPGPVVIALPEDMLTETASCTDAPRGAAPMLMPHAELVERATTLLAGAQRPLVIAGGHGWDEATSAAFRRFAEQHALPVCVSFRRQSVFPADHPHFAGDLGIGANPALLRAVAESDLVMLFGTRLSEAASQGYTLLEIPHSSRTLIHVHAGESELGRVYQPDLAIQASPRGFLAAASQLPPPALPDRAAWLQLLRQTYLDWSDQPTHVPGRFNFGRVVKDLAATLPADAIVTTGAGNYASWVNRFYPVRSSGGLLGPTCGSMGYGIPAAIAAARIAPHRQAVAFAGDGCFLMNGQEFATAVQYDARVVVVIVDNGMYGTIRMHQEMHYPGRVVATALRNPDFAAYAQAFGGYGETVETTEDFLPAFARAVASGRPAILHCKVDPEALTPGRTLSELRGTATR